MTWQLENYKHELSGSDTKSFGSNQEWSNSEC